MIIQITFMLCNIIIHSKIININTFLIFYEKKKKKQRNKKERKTKRKKEKKSNQKKRNKIKNKRKNKIRK